jgi:hypothetical protein
MNTRLTRWLVLLALGLFAFIFFYERRVPDTNEKAERAARLFPGLTLSDITGLNLARGTNFLLRLERRNDQWRFLAPVAYPAQPGGIERLLNALIQLRLEGIISAQEVLAQTNGLASFGLSPPAAIIELIQQSTNRLEVRVGRQPWLGHPQVYLQVVGRDGVLATGADFVRALPASPDDWRDRALVNLTGVDFDRVEVRTGANTLEVVRSPNRQWQMTKPLLTRANSARLDFLLQQLQMATVLRFLTDDPRADLEPFGLLPPERDLVFSRGTNELLALQLGRSPTNAPNQVFVRRLSHSNVVLVARPVVEPWRASFREFCDRRMMVFRPEAVDRIEVRGDEAFALQRESKDTWRISEPFTAPADNLLVLEMLANLASLEFLEFEKEVVTDFAAYGLAPPRRQYMLRAILTNAPPAPTNQVLAQVDFGNPSGYKLFARRSLENSVVTTLDPDRLPRAAFQLRDRRLWNVATNEIRAIVVQQQGRTRKLLRTGPLQWSMAPGSVGAVNPFSLEEAAHQVGHLRAETWTARGEEQLARYGFLIADHRVTLELAPGGPAASLTVRFGRKSLSGRPFAAVELPGERGPVVFECPLSIYDFVQSDLTAPNPASGSAP